MIRHTDLTKSRLNYTLLIFILLISAGLRLYKLSAQSFWNDEGNTARLVERPVSLIIEGAAGDIHPPGYYLILHIWRGFVGESEFALRAYSALCGILTVAITAAIGRQAGGQYHAIGAALFVAVHPLNIYYSQEARMYAQLGLISALTLYTSTRLIKNRHSRFMDVFFFALVIAAGLYTQYAYIFALFGLNVMFGLYWLASRPWHLQNLWHWIAAHILGALLFAPWAPIALRASGWRPPDLDNTQALRVMARTLFTGITLPAHTGNYVISIALVLFMLALLTRARQTFIKWSALGMALFPAALILTLGMYRPAYLKFLMASVAPLGIFLALPLSGRPQRAAVPRRWATSLLLLTLMPAQIAALHHLYTNPAYARDDYRSIVSYITAESRPGDAILLNAPNQWEVFTYYYKGPMSVYPAPYRPTKPQVNTWLEDIIHKHNRLFVLFWGDTESDPERLIEAQLAQYAYKATDTWITSIRLVLYGTDDLPESPAVLEAYELGSRIKLTGYSIPTHPFHNGDVVPLTLFWQVDAQPEERYKVFIHLIDSGGTLRAQTDAEPGGGFQITTQWTPAQRIVDRYGVHLPQDLTPGDYIILVGMYNFAGERLPIVRNGQAIGDTISLTQIQVAKHK